MEKIISHNIIYKDEKYYSTFPWATVDSKGRIHLVFRQAQGLSLKASKSSQTLTHHASESWISTLESSDDGKTWKNYRKLYNNKNGLNDPAVTCLKNGSLMVRVCELDVVETSKYKPSHYPLISHRAEHGLVTSIIGNSIFELEVNGNVSSKSKNESKSNTSKNKSIKSKLIAAGDLSRSCSREPLIELPDGTLLLSVYKGAPFETDKSYLLRSFDGGKTWPVGSPMFADSQNPKSDLQGVNFNETSVVDLGGGEMLAMARADESFFTEEEFMPVGGVGKLYSARSYNWGLSWSKPQQTGIFGQPAHLLKLDEKTLLCTYGYRKKPYGIRAVLSHDLGFTWDLKNEIILRDDGLNFDLGYPMTIKLNSGQLLTFYYFSDEAKTRFIASTLWQWK